jgi:hypothetical protein
VPTTLDRQRAAHEIIMKCRSRGWQIGPDGSLDVLPVLRGKTEPPEDKHRVMLMAVLPEVLAIKFGTTSTTSPVRPGSTTTSTAGSFACSHENDRSATAGPGATGKPAPPVPSRVQTKVRSLISQTTGNPDPAFEAILCQTLCDALNDQAEESRSLFLGLARSVRRKFLPQHIFQDAFECACGRHVRNRGAVFTASVKRFTQNRPSK